MAKSLNYWIMSKVHSIDESHNALENFGNTFYVAELNDLIDNFTSQLLIEVGLIFSKDFGEM